ncbi:MAG: NarK/NasA family nitrate transporter [Pseudomonadales bacterium]|nr:NarK/NasA family nitrate transporter [Pseudomonadales bacterium]
MQKSFWQSGHTPTLLSAFLYFDLSFMVWYVLGPLSVQIAADLGLDASQRGMLVATPILSGALLRMVFGVLVDHFKPRMAGIIAQVIMLAALTVAWLAGIHSYTQALVLGLFLGVAGAAFAVALPLASRWYPPEHQGKALGIAGAGNSGTVFAALFAPWLASLLGWTNVLGCAVLPLSVAFIVYLLCAKDAPECPPQKKFEEYLKVLQDKDSWLFMGFYCVTFGGFVGLAGALPGYFHDQYGLEPMMAGYYTAACVFGGSLMRPVGGLLADRFGGIRSLTVVYTLVGLLIFLVGTAPAQAWLALVLFVSAMLVLGAGNGSVFQLVPQRFNKEIGVMTGLIGMAGGIGGFLLAAGLGYSKSLTGSYQVGLWLYAGLALCSWLGLLSVKMRWRTTWGSLTAARV